MVTMMIAETHSDNQNFLSPMLLSDRSRYTSDWFFVICSSYRVRINSDFDERSRRENFALVVTHCKSSDCTYAVRVINARHGRSLVARYLSIVVRRLRERPTAGIRLPQGLSKLVHRFK